LTQFIVDIPPTGWPHFNRGHSENEAADCIVWRHSQEAFPKQR